MVVITIGPATATTIISDHATPASGVYAWNVVDVKGNGAEPRAALSGADTAAQVNIKKKNYDFTGIYRIVDEPITTAVYWDSLRDALDYWDANDTRLYLSVKNEWAANLATRGSKASPTVQTQYRGKLFNFRWMKRPAEVLVSIEFRYTTA